MRSPALQAPFTDGGYSGAKLVRTMRDRGLDIDLITVS